MTDLNVQHNRVVWFDIPVANLERASAFYQAVLAVQVQLSECEGVTFGLIEHDQGNGGCLVPDAAAIRRDGGVLIYLNTEGRIRKALDQVSRVGGEILEPVNAIGEYGFRAIVRDSEGNRIAFYSSIDA